MPFFFFRNLLIFRDSYILISSAELYFRHIYSKREQPSLNARFESWHNYRQLFDYVLGTRPLSLALQLRLAPSEALHDTNIITITSPHTLRVSR